MFKLRLTDPWNIAHITIIKTKNTTDILILQSGAATVCTINISSHDSVVIFILPIGEDLLVNNDRFVKN